MIGALRSWAHRLCVEEDGARAEVAGLLNFRDHRQIVGRSHSHGLRTQELVAAAFSGPDPSTRWGDATGHWTPEVILARTPEPLALRSVEAAFGWSGR